MKDKKELEKLYGDCISFWGIRAQLRQTQEECAELILAASHFNRKRPDGEDNVIEEVGDVYLMIQQMMHYFGRDKVMEIVDKKSDRVRNKLNSRDIN